MPACGAPKSPGTSTAIPSSPAREAMNRDTRDPALQGTGEKPPVAKWGSTAVRFADQAEARTLLGRADAFTSAMGAFDRQARLATVDSVDRASFLQHAAGQVRGWPAGSWERWQKSIRKIGETLGGLNVPLPDTVLFITTTGAEEFGKPYTRGTAIVIPEAVAQNLQEPFGLIAHELFHIVSRHAPQLRDELFGITGFRRVGPVTHPPSYGERRLTNPDAYENEHALAVVEDDRTFLAVPLIRSKSAIEDAIGAALSQSLEIFLLEVDDKGQTVLDAYSTPMVHSVLATDYNQQAAVNTEYAIHPEEVLADNFALMLERRSGRATAVKRTDVLDKIEAIFRR